MPDDMSAIGYIPADDEYLKHKKVYDACNEADVDVPDETDQFFDGYPPTEHGTRVDIRNEPCIEDYDEEMSEGFVIDLTKLHPSIKKIAIYKSY